MGLADLFKIFGGGKPKVDLWRRYEKLHESSSGTMSVFYKVRDRRTGEIVGLKIVNMAKAAPSNGGITSSASPMRVRSGWPSPAPTS